MFQNYIKIAGRVLSKNKVYVVINLLGLGFALTCCILSYINYDYRASFDKNRTHTENVYRLNTLRNIDNSDQRWGITPVAIGEYLAKDMGEGERTARLLGKNIVVKNKANVFAEKVYYVDKNIFSFFNLPLKQGNYNQFNEKNTIIISQPLAEKYFGKDEPVGRQLTMVLNGKEEIFSIIGLLEKIPLNSSFQFDILTAFNNAFAAGDASATDLHSELFVTTFAEINNREKAILLAKQLTPFAAVCNSANKDWKIKSFYFQPFKEVALSSDVDFPQFVQGRELNTNPRGVLVITPIVLSAFILLITCFNFTNISIAFASRRLKEIGVRKVLGARKSQLIIQFLTENILLCLVASSLGLFFVYRLLPVLNSWTGIDLQLKLGQNLTLWIILLGLPVIAAIVAGLYPSVYISSFEPVGILKGNTTFGPRSRITRILLVTQFSISCLALTVGITLTKNAFFQKEVDFGYAINEVAVTEISSGQEYRALSNAVRSNLLVEGVAGAEQQIGASTRETTVHYETNELKVQVAGVGGEEYLKAMGIKLLLGRHFHSNEGLHRDQSILVNQKFAEKLNLTEPLGKQIKLDSANYTIVGVFQDYKEFGLHGLVPPCVLKLAKTDDYKFMVVRANKNNLANVEKAIRATWYKLLTGKPYNGFLQKDVILKEEYMNAGLQSVSLFLAGVIILLSASGLFAWVSLNILRRNKEIGVRKVLGASVAKIIGLVVKDFLYMLLIAFLIGSSLGYLIINKIIFNFIYAYHPALGPDVFILTLLILLLSCLITVGVKVFKAASSNPVIVLKAD